MNSLLEKNYIKELLCGDNLSYIVEDNNYFSATEYRFLQNHTEDVFVKCVKMLFNGKIQLYYVTESFKSVSEIVGSLNENEIFDLFLGIFNGIIIVKNNGFLQCQSIDIDLEHIFWDSKNKKIKFVYVPIEKRFFDNYSDFEQSLRTQVYELIKKIVPIPKNRNVRKLIDNIIKYDSIGDIVENTKNEADTLEHIETPSKTVGHQNGFKKASPIKKRTEMKSVLYLKGKNSPYHLEFKIEDTNYIIGKNVSQSNGIIDYDPFISRKHCKIVKKVNKYYVVDLSSTNGTYLNGKLLDSDIEIELHNKDILRIANSEFEVMTAYYEEE